MSAIFNLALQTGANRVVKGARIEHVVGDPSLGPEKDQAFARSIVETALRALRTEVSEPTLFVPNEMDVAETAGVA